MSIPPNHRHDYGSWFNSGTCQRRQCSCGQTETQDHNWGSWMVDHYQIRGDYHGDNLRHDRPSKKEKRVCSNCNATETRG